MVYVGPLGRNIKLSKVRDSGKDDTQQLSGRTDCHGSLADLLLTKGELREVLPPSSQFRCPSGSLDTLREPPPLPEPTVQKCPSHVAPLGTGLSGFVSR